MRYLISLKFVVIVLFLIGFTEKSFGQNELSWKVKDAEQSFPYLKIELLPINKIVYTNQNGIFRISSDLISNIEEIYFSGFGINDTIIPFSSLQNESMIFLNAKWYELPEFSLSGKPLNSFKIGDHKKPSHQETKPIALGNSNLVSYRYTVFVELPKREKRLISSFQFKVADLIREPVLVSIRFLGSVQKNLDRGKMYPISEFVDLGNVPLVKKINVSGWNQVELVDGILIPNSIASVFVIIDLLDYSGENFFALDNQDVSKNIEQGFYYTSGMLGIFNKGKYHPAIELEINY